MTTLKRTIQCALHAGLLALAVYATGCKVTDGTGLACTEQYQCPGAFICSTAGHCVASCPSGQRACAGFCQADNLSCGIEPGETLSVVIGPDGGTVVNGMSTVSIPAGALMVPTTMTSTEVPAAPLRADLAAVSIPYTFGPEGQQFNVPSKVTLQFDPTKIPAGKTTASLAIYTAPAGSTNFVALASTLVDSTHIAALTTHFSTFVTGVYQAPDGGSGLQPPANLSYSPNPAIFTIGESGSESPSISGGAVMTYSISPTLPAGLNIGLSTGIISGTPTALSPQTSYTITATNDAGMTTAILPLAVHDIPPSGLAYSANPAVYAKGTPITTNTPSTSGGGAVTAYSIAPSLPAGLSLSTTTGIITGTPTAITSATTYTVTASNTGGSTQVSLTITVTDAAPTTLSYSTNPATYTIRQAITNDTPSNQGGAVTSYAINSSLPSGLSFDTSGGVVSGTPQLLSPATNYVITAMNAGGSTTVTLSVAVVDVPPAGLSYSASTAVYTLGQTIAQNFASTNGGGAVVSYSIAPALPAGLALNTNTGTISGRPTGLAPAASYVVTATNSGGSTTAMLNLAVVAVSPSSLSYATNPAVYTINQAITSDAPSVSGGAVVSWAITPALPAGLSLDPTTGILSGTPSLVAATTSYTVTATNSGGSTSVTLTLTVNDVPPTGLAYTTNPAVYTLNQAIVPDAPSSTGGTVVSYAISPTLPAGLSFDTTQGIVSGTPTALSTQTGYTVTATNSGGSTSVTLNLAVIDVPPTALTYATNPAVFTKGRTITADRPSSSGGPVVSYAITPALPAGLLFNTATGLVSGTPTVLSAATSYTVTATNTGGSTSAALTLTVNDQVPSALVYSSNPAIYTKGQTIPDNAPSNSGGTVLSYAVSPPLPAGLTLSPTTGIITGTPTVVAAEATYTVTATNTVGFTTAALVITVNDVPPSELTYPVTTAVYTVEEEITSNAPESSVGVTSYGIAPTLPAGLSFDTTSGTISGAPTVLSPQAYYTVTAYNSGGSATATLSITVVDLPPTGLTYTTNPAIYTKGSAIVTNVPATTGGGAVIAYAIAPALPGGLSLNPTTGVISGTPSAVATLNSYVVTATNSGGSTTATLSITVNDVAPSSLSYPTTTAVYTKGQAITPDAPSNNTGVTGYSINPTLPTGLSFNTTTGAITGTPTVLSAAAYYTVTATNTGGSATTTLSIAVVDVAPTQLTYATITATYVRGTAITPNPPTVNGGPVISWTIAPALPAGLIFTPATGTISGTPSAVSSLATYTVTATNSGGSAQVSLFITVNDVAPTGLAYAANPVVYTKGIQITNNTPSSSGGAVTAYSVAPALPAGLSFSTTTGIITGTPSAVAAITNYNVTASNSGGSTQVTLQITVIDQAPINLSYALNPAVYTKGLSITNNVPSNSGGAVVSWSISPALPVGLTFNTTTGVIAGTPAVLSTTTNYTVQAANTGGSTNATLTITVNDVAPAGLTYSLNPAVYTKGQALTANMPSTSGGPVVSYAVNPALPAGLSLNTTNGVITGTPTGLAPLAGYVVTATNSGGFTTTTLTLTVNDVAPSALAYPTNPAVYTKGQTATDVPTYGGGTVVSWSVTPALPGGLSLSPTTGVLSGTPTVVSAQATYTVTATNSGGSTQAMLTITVNDVAPSNLTYSSNPAVYTIGQLITPDTLASNVGVLSYGIAPTLPAGLSFNTTTGAITGTPTVLSPAAYYTVTATNSGGSTQASLSVAVVDVPPAALTYTTGSAVYTKGQAITSDAPSSTGGAVVSYAITPALPAGLSFSPTTGVISGTPAVVSASTTYTVTATNSGGSTTAALQLAVIDLVPTTLTYVTGNAAYMKGAPIAANVPSNNGGTIVSYAISPSLPSGLVLSTTSGIISGTPVVLSTQATYTVTGTNSGGSTTATLQITVNDVAPAGLTYSTNPAVYTNGETITNDVPSTGGGPVTTWAISPSLPAGLSFSPSTGVLSGTPTALSTVTTYTVTATNTGGSTTASLQITVNDVPPSSLAYTAATAVFTLGQPITSDVPSIDGGPVTSWAIVPALPVGLSFDTGSGIIAGTPGVLSAATGYTVTAQNSGGATSATLHFTVVDVPPAGLTYGVAVAVYTKGQAITANTPATAGGGPVVSYAISPTLPAGLTLSPTTGIISGTPAVLATMSSYTVTATNSGGSTTATLSVTVNDVTPSGLTYATNPAVYTKGTAIAGNTPSSSGGPVISYAISPTTLPTGLSFSPTTGILSGTPTVLAPQASFTVTATNTGGSTQVTLALTVNDVPPAALSYATSTGIYTKGTPITSNPPTISGGPVVTYSVSPSLPTGLSLNPGTGIISGTPSVVSATTFYTVTATNSGGSTTATLSITVNDFAPITLEYSSNPATYTKGTPIASNAPSNGGGVVTSYTVAPALPTGLSFSTTTGVISGTPEAVSGQTVYTVTAYNSGGSTNVSLFLTVNDIAPVTLTYAANPLVATKGQAITSDVPSNGGGTVISWAISPALPAGLSLDPTTGIVSGTPSVLATQTGYTVTATNTGGQTNTTLTITVNDVAPSALAYATNPAVYTKGTTITNDVPSNSGGPVVSWTITPTLPTGLTFSTTAGTLSGTPTALSATTIYTVTATNSGGFTQAMLSLTVNDVAPSSVSYATNPAVYTKGTQITTNTTTSSGGAVVSWSVVPALPQGLSLSPGTGAISGTPSAVTAQATYAVTASNSGGTAMVQLILTVNDVAPSSLTYAVNPAVFTVNQQITADTVASNAGIISYGIAPTLPAGLSFDTTTGSVSGTPTVLSPAAYYTVTAMNSGGSTTAQLSVAVVDVPPSGLTYTTSTAVYVKGAAIASNTPATSGGGAVVSYAISPALPTGLSFSPTTGVVSGTPTVVSAATAYTATATNSGGSTTTTLHLTVNDIPPTALTYGTSAPVYTKGQAITADVPSSGGGTIVSYAISPALPTGLSLNTATGTITGTPSVLSSQTTYTVTASNSGGTTQATLFITVNDVAPSGLTYATNPAVYTEGEAITNDVPTNGGGTVVSWAITPALPSGLSFNPATGVISGTPTVLSTVTTYTVTAVNTGGSTQASLQITVNDVPPSALSYATGTAVYTVWQQITSNAPSISGGPVTSWAISPALPAGMSFNLGSGVISGTPTVLSTLTSYTVTATNSGGSTTASLSITVNDVGPSSLSYAFAAPIYTKGQSIMSDGPSSGGGPVVSYAITPAVPAGLSFSTTSGTLSGTPTVVSSTTSYTVTATNSGGSTTAALSITVNDVAPSSLTYATLNGVYTKGTAITSNAPTNGGGAVISYAISPVTLPGLSFNTTTGVISGTPTVLMATASYLVTATNSGGSTSVSLSITVNDVPPSSLSYTTSNASYTKGTAITSNTPTVFGGPVVTWAISPALPSGLTLSTTSGVITGNPSVVSATTSYTVTASNTGGSTNATLSITVNDVAPSGLTYSANPATYTLGTAISPDAPSTTGGGPVISYSILPSLSAGLSFDTATGIVSGTPTVLATSQKAYTVTATNSGGSTTTTLFITVDDMAPSALAYSTPTAVYTKGTAITSNVPSNSGGAVVSYGVIPALPTGLSLSTSTGIISGAPTVLATTQTLYTITATNSGGSTQGYVYITVNDVVPSGLTYSTPSGVYTKGTAITNNTPSSGGGPVVSYAINPSSLPAGLSFSTTTGVISGTPTVLATFAGYNVTATNSGGSTGATIFITVNDVPPSSLTYTTAVATYTKGTAIATNSPSTSGGPVTSYSVSPSLPNGLNFNTSSGTITGTPTVLAPLASYVVTASNTGGSTMVTLTITVDDMAPSSLTYTSTSPVYTNGTTITSDTPSSSGGPVVSYAITPALPTGLSLSTTTGVISGTPTVLSTATSYTVTATNTGGSTTATLTITVNDVPPSGLTYTLSTVIYTKGTPITNNTPSTSGGGPVISWSVSPSLPTGLSLNTGTGVLSGTPTVLSTATSYTVTATNTGGSTTDSLSITVNDVAPSGLTYTTPTAVYTKGTAIATNTPSTSGGGPATAYSVSPALPSGLNLNTSSGLITGTPSAVVATASYTVTASNTGGSTQDTLSITVNDVAPTNLTYATPNGVYTKGSLIVSDIPSHSGGTVISYSISPTTLPFGLSFSTSTGYISGTPTVLAPMANYTVTATNSGGSTTGPVSITVNDVPPSSLSYFTNPVSYTINQSITNNTPLVSGGPVITYGVSPALPVGLSLDTTTGIVSGIPTVLSTQTSYFVTATNTGGSTNVALKITVVDVPPSGLTYTTLGPTYTKGSAITNDVPSTTGGGPVISYAVSPSLPTGLSLNTSSGVISGTPGAVAAGASYNVTATNTGGSTIVTLYITVNDVAPSSLTYSSSAPIYTKGTAITNDTPSNSGGTVISYAIGPSLPTGLSMSTSTGIISGTPTVLSTATVYSITATNSGGSTSASVTITVNDVAPSSLTYSSNPATYTRTVTITNDTPSHSGGTVVSYAITPALPTGLTMNTSTGVVSGAATVLSTLTAYTVTATNTGGSTNATLTITVNDVVPSSLTYTTQTAVYTKGTAITNNTPSSSGGPVVSYGISPALSSGLSFNTSTGVISGTPSALLTTQTSYTVTATNTGGSTTDTIKITVNDVAPSSLTYSTSPAVYTKGTAITSNSPTSSGGPVVSYSISPSVPTGLSFNTSSGVITGTPTVLSSATNYTITATNSGGSTTDSLSITVNDVPPSSLTYTTTTATYTVGVAITSNTPSHSGGTVVSYAISPALPSGLSFSTSTGIISGTPTTVWPTTSYTVTATNTGGSTNDTLSITVNGGFIAATGALIATGNANSCTIVEGGLLCWGSTNGGSDNSLAGEISGLTSGVQAIATEYGHTCVIANGGVQCWGSNEYGQLGNNSTVGSVVPVQVSGATSGVQAVSVANDQTCAIINGGVQCWGVIGLFSDYSPVPVPVSGLTSGAQAISAGNGENCAIVNGGAQCWTLGSAVSAPQGLSAGVQAISVGDNHACAIINGGAQCWGGNSSGQLGNGSTVNSTAPVQVTGLTSGVQAIGTGGNHSCAVVNGGLQCWGINSAGELGNNSTSNSLVPVQVQGLTSGVEAVAQESNSPHTCVLANGGISCWGQNSSGQLGNNSTVSSYVPVQVVGLTTSLGMVAGGDYQTCAMVNGGAQCWGQNNSDQLGNNSTANSSVPVQVTWLTSGVQAIAEGSTHTCVVVNGGVQCWGYGGYGQLGNGAYSNSDVPVLAIESGAQAVAAGQFHSCAIWNGSVQCWGDDNYGQLGNNSVTSVGTPGYVYGLTSGAQAITGGLVHTCALVNGGVQCWGGNGSGQLGNNSTKESNIPVPVTGLTSGVTAIAAGEEGYHTCALVNGGVMCWGANPSGQLGNNSETNSLMPVQVQGLTTGVQVITAGGAHSCAVVNGAAQCWGEGFYGELGDSSTSESDFPVQVTGLTSGVISINGGYYFTCAVVNGNIECWGQNSYGDLGYGSGGQDDSPVTVSGL